MSVILLVGFSQGTAMDCLFCKIAQGEIPADIVFENETLVAFRDIRPQAPSHVLVIPRKHIATIDETSNDDQQLLGQMILTAKTLAHEEGLQQGYRLVFNVNGAGGQEVYHIHLHVIGGRQMTWPPG